jgi:cysteinyl-tRNA synthetase
MNATHYRAPINFSDEIFDAAISELNKIYTSLKQASLKLDLSDSFTINTIDENYKDKYLEQLADDMNVSGAMTILYDVVKELVNGNLQGGQAKVYGLKEDGVGIPESTKNLVPQEVLDYVNEMKEKVKNGDIKVPATESEYNKSI